MNHPELSFVDTKPSIILIGFKSVGKTVIGRALALRLNLPFIDLDEEIEHAFASNHPQKQTCRQIMETLGQVGFRKLEKKILTQTLGSVDISLTSSRRPAGSRNYEIAPQSTRAIISLGGGTPLNEANQVLIKKHTVILITAPKELVFNRIQKEGIPAFFLERTALESFNRLWNERKEVYEKLADFVVENNGHLDAVVERMVTIVGSTVIPDPSTVVHASPTVVPAKAGIHVTESVSEMGPRLRGDDSRGSWDDRSDGNNLTVTLAPPTPTSYPIHIGSDLTPTLINLISPHVSKVILITDSHLKKTHAPPLIRALTIAGFSPLLLTFPAGEKSKSTRTKSKLEETMLKEGCDRHSLILALGGGVVGDLAGFIAATFMRGIDFIQIPTTLLAMVDSSVGGKTGINTPQGKNLIGAFYQPKAVIIDVKYLKTLAKIHLINGLIEALKMFLTSDGDSLQYFNAVLDVALNYDEEVLSNIIHRALLIKANIVQQDEKEQNQRVILNFGHTIGHALEKISNYQLLHGYAVAYGILIEAKIAELMGLLAKEDFLFIKTLLVKLDPSFCWDDIPNYDTIIQATKNDKKTRAGTVNYVLLNGLGSVYHHQNHYAHPVPPEVVRRAVIVINED